MGDGALSPTDVARTSLVLETLVAPVVTMDDWGAELRPTLRASGGHSRQPMLIRYLNYCDNQRKKML